ncbi:MAG TPA: hypothetical protein EYO51_06610 [Methylococcaceae bacterium]|nr:hypothetical protein [Methylococcaceae bacterium]HIN68885.1 hypothetical protein [Methylococcales bacterium]HIO12190.1 hypothetical protein [Methylococcales bacterium]
MKKPIKCCYWVVPGKVLAGEHPVGVGKLASSENLDALKEAAVTTFIDLTGEPEGLASYASLLDGQAYHRFSITNIATPRSPDITTAILDLIDQQATKEGVVYIHCRGGVGRTGTIIGCWLTRQGFKGANALLQLNKLWLQNPKSAESESPETKQQKDYILSWKENFDE